MVSGAFRRVGGSAIGGYPVTLQYRPPSSTRWKSYQSVTTNRRGQWKVRVKADRAYAYRVVYRTTAFSRFRTAVSATRTTTFTYPRLVLPQGGYRVDACQYQVNGEDVVARAKIQWLMTGGVYQKNTFGIDYHYDGRPWYAPQADVTEFNEAYSPETELQTGWTGNWVNPPGAYSTTNYITLPTVWTAIKLADCTQVAAFTI